MDEIATFTLTARQWATVDAEMDNSAYAARDGFYVDDDDDDELPPPDALAKAIRQAGWRQVPWVGDDRAWPPDDQLLVISLHPGQWRYVVEELRGADATYASLGDDESLRLGRDVVAAIEAQLSDSQGSGAETS